MTPPSHRDLFAPLIDDALASSASRGVDLVLYCSKARFSFGVRQGTWGFRWFQEWKFQEWKFQEWKFQHWKF
ncbi:hypothetical protein FRD01_22710 [Microvenator marinus]|uniref:Uncharacterized protein n=1 Tax=Microvenator marinus TaxID=2600177 RepID=A0A5B8XVQ3_9DELT|nr:hypothetical protein [Microvenator marinus]QED29992.1 hypothetical protein FRD01_22710 [Microvenator marinus]